MSRRIEDCHVELQMKLLACIQEWANAGLDVLVTCTHRTNAEQQVLYDQGRSKPGHIVTRAKPGQSSHNFTVHGKPASLAFDIVPLAHGKPVWGTIGEDLELWRRCASIAKSKGLKWYGDPGSEFVEYPHFEIPTASELMRHV